MVIPMVRAISVVYRLSAQAMTPIVAAPITAPTSASQSSFERGRIGPPGRRGFRSIKPSAWLAVAEPDRLEDLGREVDPQRLQRDERRRRRRC